MQEQEEVGQGTGGQETLKSCSWVSEGMERPGLPALLRATKGALFSSSGIRFKSAINPQSSRLLSCALSPPARSPSLGRLSELCSPGLHSLKPVASLSDLKRRKLIELLSPTRRSVFAMYTRPVAEADSCCQTAQLQQWLFLPSFPPWCVVSVCRRFPFSLNEGKSAVVCTEVLLLLQETHSN